MDFVNGSISKLSDEYQKLGASEGSGNRPPSQSVSLDLNEVNLVTKAKKFITGQEALFSDELMLCDKKISEIEHSLESLTLAADSALSNDLVESSFRSALAKHDHELVDALAKEMVSRATLKGYKSKHSISQQAKYPEDRLFHFSLLVLFVAIETGVNAFFFEGSSGLIGGAMIALAVSVVNMGVAATLGSFFRYVNLSDTKSKVVGYLSLTVFLSLGVVLNLIFSTFRFQYQLLVSNLDIAEPTLLQLASTFKEAVFDAFGVFALHFPTADFNSLILFFIGFLCSALAFWKGYTVDDKYPGHGELDRLHKASEKTFSLAKDIAVQEAINNVTNAAKEIERIRNSILDEQRNVNSLNVQTQASQTKYSAKVKIVQDELNFVIETYRSTNSATRASARPVYFDTQIIVLPPTDGSERISPIIKKIDLTGVKAKNIVDKQVKILGERLAEIHQKTNELVQKALPAHLSELKDRASLQLGKF